MKYPYAHEQHTENKLFKKMSITFFVFFFLSGFGLWKKAYLKENAKKCLKTIEYRNPQNEVQLDFVEDTTDKTQFYSLEINKCK